MDIRSYTDLVVAATMMETVATQLEMVSDAGCMTEQDRERVVDLLNRSVELMDDVQQVALRLGSGILGKENTE